MKNLKPFWTFLPLGFLFTMLWVSPAMAIDVKIEGASVQKRGEIANIYVRIEKLTANDPIFSLQFKLRFEPTKLSLKNRVKDGVNVPDVTPIDGLGPWKIESYESSAGELRVLMSRTQRLSETDLAAKDNRVVCVPFTVNFDSDCTDLQLEPLDGFLVNEVNEGSPGAAVVGPSASVCVTDTVPQTTKITFSPVELTVSLGESFTMDLRVENITALAGWQLDVHFNSDVLEATQVAEGDFLKQGGADTFWRQGNIDNAQGTITRVNSARLGLGGANGTGRLLTITFKAKKGGGSRMELQNLSLSDASGQLIPHQMLTGKVTVVDSSPGDANRDGRVDIRDLVLVAQSFGQEPPKDPRADVNQDGKVDIRDLVLVAQHFGESTKAVPAAPPQMPNRLHADMIQQWIRLARAVDDGSETFQRGIVVLEKLLHASVPTSTALFPNYPNPFNPETWIPFRLAKDSLVTLTISNMNGQVVRAIQVGHLPAAVYESRDKAIYWDGRNDQGEHVASGVYLYTLTANHFTQTRKMLILK